MSHRRKMEEKHRLKKLYNASKNHCWFAGAWYDEDKDRIIKTKGSNTAWLKRRCSKVTRLKAKNIINSSREKSDYKKYFDYQWELH